MKKTLDAGFQRGLDSGINNAGTEPMPNFISDATYDRLLSDLRNAALCGDWRSALAEALAGADILPEVCRGDFVKDGVRVAA